MSTIAQNLRGGLHYFAQGSSEVGNTAIETAAGTALRVARTGKFLSAVPIVAGAPDATHTYAGHSGSYSYNVGPWQHTLDYYKRLGVKVPYINFDSTPQILGGSPTAPMTATNANNSTHLVGFEGYNKTVPTSNTEYAKIAADFYYWVTRDYDGYASFDEFIWGFWNEPGGAFWGGTNTQLFDLWKATVTAIQAIDPGVQIGGMELAGVDATFTNDLMSYLSSNSMTLPHFSFHIWSGDIGSIAYFYYQLAKLATTYSITAPPLVIGEGGWQSALLYGSPYKPFDTVNAMHSDWGAAFKAAVMVSGQKFGAQAAIITQALHSEPTNTSFNAAGLFSTAHPWAAQNVFYMWEKLGSSTVISESSSNLENGVFVLCCEDTDGTVSVFAVNHKWRRDRVTDLTITLPSSTPNVTPIYYLVDHSHSNFYDAATGGSLETVTAPTVSGGQVTLQMQPSSVHLLRFTNNLLPVNTVAPAVSGSAVVGQTLSVSDGTWTGDPAPTFTYQWQRSGANIGGATSSTYTLVDADDGSTIACVVTGTNAEGVGSATSNSSAAVIEVAPANSVLPALGGSNATVGLIITCGTGTWLHMAGAGAHSFTYQWQVSNNGTSGWSDIAGQTIAGYTITSDKVNKFLRCQVTAHNTSGTDVTVSTAASNKVTVVLPIGHAGSGSWSSLHNVFIS